MFTLNMPFRFKILNLQMRLNLALCAGEFSIHGLFVNLIRLNSNYVRLILYTKVCSKQILFR